MATAFLGSAAAQRILRGAPLGLLPLGSVRPTGWLHRQLIIQANGLSGHLDEVWPDVGPESGWLGGNGEKFERGPYWLDGVVPLAYLLDDGRLKAKIKPWIEWIFASQTEDGNFGPRVPDNDWWPRMVVLKVMTQYWEAAADPRVIPFLQRYFVYQQKALPGQPLTSWARYRWQENALSVLWLYDRHPDRKLIRLADLLREQGFDWQSEFRDFKYTGKTDPAIARAKAAGYHETHGVDIAMGLKPAGVVSRFSRDPAPSPSAADMLAVLDRFHGLPNLLYSASEHLAGRDSSQGTELCTVVEMLYSLEQALAATGDPGLADRLEHIAFNALPGTLSDDMWSHQYDQQPNQIECTRTKRPWDNGKDANLFGLAPNYGCCTANFNQGWPKLTSSLWMRRGSGLAAMIYAPCTVNTMVDQTAVRLDVQTDYPFRNDVHIEVSLPASESFALSFRIPHRAEMTVAINGKAHAWRAQGGFIKVYRRWSNHDRIKLSFNMPTLLVDGVDGSISVRRGPLLFALPIDTEWRRLAEHGRASDWELTGKSPWNYGLLRQTRVRVQEHPVGEIPFGKDSPPVTLDVSGVLLKKWLEESGNAGVFPAKREKQPDASLLTSMRLVPYASTKLRITAFPGVGPSVGSSPRIS
ncbi:MAG: hypothetical protein ACRYFU_15140 [Janthinobacterium lividum]